MGSGIARRLANENQLALYDVDAQQVHELANELKAHHCKTGEEAIAASDIIILAVKPQNLKDIAALKFKPKQLLISILAGTNIQTLKGIFPSVGIVRLMPNLAVSYGEGIIGAADSAELSSEIKNTVSEICKPLGNIFWLEESKIDALTSIGGSGPAFALVIIEAMIDASIAMGFKPEQGRQFVLQMLSGTLTMLNETGKHPAELRWQVTSPGGTTIAGLKRMEEEKVRSGVINTFLAAYERAKQISSEK